MGEIRTDLGTNHDKFTVSLLKDATVIGHGFRGCFGTPSGSRPQGPSLVKLPVEESVVKN